MEHGVTAKRRESVYREFPPCPELREYVRALAWYGPADDSVETRVPIREFRIGEDRTLPPSFADVHTSILFALGASYGPSGWHPSDATGATVMGAMTRATPPFAAERSAMIGVYLRPRGAAAIVGVRATELADRIVPLNDIWKGFALEESAPTLESVEGLIARRLRAASYSHRATQIAELASHVRRRGGRVSVETMADWAGLSRQHLRRLFLDYVGVTPKQYARLARFRTGLRQLGNRERFGGWSRFSAQLGYADQSHMIADFREFASFTPEQLARGECFHPFIGDGSRVEG